MTSHRHFLERQWLGGKGTVNFIMLNPSTADESVDDPTIRKCVGFSKLWGFESLIVTNLFTYRATDPKMLAEMARADYAQAIGHNADGWLIDVAAMSNAVVCAWGDHGSLAGRDEDVKQRVLPNIALGAIGKTRKGNPLHPCRAPYTSSPEVYRIAVEIT